MLTDCPDRRTKYCRRYQLNRPRGNGRMVPEAPACTGGRAAGDPQHPAPRPYQYYGRPTNSQSLLKFCRDVVRIWRQWLNRRPRQNRMTWRIYNQLLVGILCCRLRFDIPGRTRRVCLRNPLREICTVGSVREETSRWCHGRPQRAQSWKRRTQPKEDLQPIGISSARRDVSVVAIVQHQLSVPEEDSTTVPATL
jgi:hypothetical protein